MGTFCSLEAVCDLWVVSGLGVYRGLRAVCDQGAFRGHIDRLLSIIGDNCTGVVGVVWT